MKRPFIEPVWINRLRPDLSSAFITKRPQENTSLNIPPDSPAALMYPTHTHAPAMISQRNCGIEQGQIKAETEREQLNQSKNQTHLGIYTPKLKDSLSQQIYI